MSQPQIEQPSSRATLGETRVDGPHLLREASEPGRNTRIDPPAVMAAPTAVEASYESEMLRVQAAQLAAQLQRRQAELDRREAQLNAASLQFDQDARNARLWFAERQHELDTRQEQLEEHERGLADRRSQLLAAEQFHQTSQQALRGELAARDEDLAAREAELARQAAIVTAVEAANRRAAVDLEDRRRAADDALRLNEQRFDQRQAQVLAGLRLAQENLDKRRRQIERDAADHERQRHTIVPHSEIVDRHRLAQLAEREQFVEQAREALAQEQRLLDEERARLAERETRITDRLQQEQQRLEASYGRFAAGLEERRQGLERRQDELDARAAALDQLRGNLEAVHRETLEIRLVTEELWAQLAARVPGPALSPAIGQLRAKLADHFHLLAEQLDHRRAQMQAAKSDLAGEHARLSEQRQQLHDWAQRRHVELDQLAARLVARADELERREAANRQLEDAWRGERLVLQAELANSKAQLALQARQVAPIKATASAPRKTARRNQAA